MNDALLSAVLERLKDNPFSPEAEDLLLAGLAGDDALNEQLNADPAHRYDRASTSDTAASKPVGAYLRSVTVAGFRGIGPTATLEVTPGPGLTLVVGRNGSGKSSFAEALEVLLTGTLVRWAPPAPTVVREGWRSKHAGGDTKITAEFFIEGSGKAAVCRSWAADVELTGSIAWMQQAGEKRAPLSALGWDTDLKEYRPFLSHAELEAFFGKPSELHDLLASVLGLEDLASADKRLNGARKIREGALSEVKGHLKALRARVQSIAGQDERAQACLTALSGNVPAKWDIPAAEAAAISATVADGGALAALRGLAQLTPPPEEEVSATIADARSAAGGLRDVAGTNAAQARELAALLDAALEHYHVHGDGDCPVCGNSGAMTAAWRAANEENRNRLRGEAVAANDAFEKARAAARRVTGLLSPIPAVLAADGHVPAVDVAVARQSWSAWIAPVAEREVTSDTTPESLTSLAHYLEAEFPALVSAVTAVATATAEEVASRDDQWVPVAADVADDPVQAMDPSKVDEERQVIVFTHDNRIVSAIKDLCIPATILEVTRQPRSQVTVRECLDASSQAIKDARALNKDLNIPLEVAERVIPGLCRTAVEAAFTSAYWRTALRKGRSRTEIEESLEPNGKRVNLRGIAHLALFGEVEVKDGGVPGYLNKQWGSRHADTYQALNKGAHTGYAGDLAGLIEDTKAFVRKITEKLP